MYPISERHYVIIFLIKKWTQLIALQRTPWTRNQSKAESKNNCSLKKECRKNMGKDLL